MANKLKQIELAVIPGNGIEKETVLEVLQIQDVTAEIHGAQNIMSSKKK